MANATISTGPKLGLLNNAPIGASYYDQLRPFLRGMDALVQGTVIAEALIPPTSPNNGDSYIVNPGNPTPPNPGVGTPVTYHGTSPYNGLTAPIIPDTMVMAFAANWNMPATEGYYSNGFELQNGDTYYTMPEQTNDGVGGWITAYYFLPPSSINNPPSPVAAPTDWNVFGYYNGGENTDADFGLFQFSGVDTFDNQVSSSGFSYDATATITTHEPTGNPVLLIATVVGQGNAGNAYFNALSNTEPGGATSGLGGWSPLLQVSGGKAAVFYQIFEDGINNYTFEWLEPSGNQVQIQVSLTAFYYSQPTAPTGAWLNQGNALAVYSTQITTTGNDVLTPGWDFYLPQTGWMVYNNAEQVWMYYTGAGWSPTQYLLLNPYGTNAQLVNIPSYLYFWGAFSNEGDIDGNFQVLGCDFLCDNTMYNNGTIALNAGENISLASSYGEVSATGNSVAVTSANSIEIQTNPTVQDISDVGNIVLQANGSGGGSPTGGEINLVSQSGSPSGGISLTAPVVNVNAPTIINSTTTFNGLGADAIYCGANAYFETPVNMLGTVYTGAGLNSVGAIQSGLYAACGAGFGIGQVTQVGNNSLTAGNSPATNFCNAVSGAFTLILPDATISPTWTTVVPDAGTGTTYTIPPGWVIIFKKTDASSNIVTLTPLMGQSVEGQAYINLTKQNEFVVLQTDGSNWWIIGGSQATLTQASTSTQVTSGKTAYDASAGAITATLLAASAYLPGTELTIKKIDSSANTVTIQPAGSDVIDGNATYTLSTQYQYVRFFSDGVSNWYIDGSN